MNRFQPRAAVILLTPLILWGCTSAYYAAMEQVGRHKRDILESRVRAGQKDQREAEEQFLTTFERFKKVSGSDGGNLETVYNGLQKEYDRSESKADDVRDRIESIEEVAAELFKKWQGEIELISNADLRRGSQQSLADTKQGYAELIRAMKRAESRMGPVLVAFRDQVLFLKHNLNARAIASLQKNVIKIEADVDNLIRDMQRSIREAESFLQKIES